MITVVIKLIFFWSRPTVTVSMVQLVHDDLPGSSKLLLHTTLARFQDVLRHHFLVQSLHVYDDPTIPPHMYEFSALAALRTFQ